MPACPPKLTVGIGFGRPALLTCSLTRPAGHHVLARRRRLPGLRAVPASCATGSARAGAACRRRRPRSQGPAAHPVAELCPAPRPLSAAPNSATEELRTRTARLRPNSGVAPLLASAGDASAAASVLDAPGHSPGHCSRSRPGNRLPRPRYVLRRRGCARLRATSPNYHSQPPHLATTQPPHSKNTHSTLLRSRTPKQPAQ